ncbi:LppP/LprE family lipoprotein [Kibdelosporangium philippinense]|uniref:LppP/LprE family lipoprotein n=1 Tax=Kibdelosporangium philippinense TaxID=211113 RepID=A0ABS8ZJL1_9PSEU|nr:LppP/LprE family lipoprotein [Kibdelosporangium philippinense]MCE7006821.1 LppP/LprE family lipoprotein [Kibdelosporangium philippinense]
MRGVAVGLMCLMLLGGCATAGGIKVEGPATQVTPPPSTPPPPSGVIPSFDPVALLRTDSKVTDKIKSLLTPCPQSGRFPVDSRYVDLTGDGVAEMIVAVTYCDTTIPVGKVIDTRFGSVATYVYDVVAKPPVDLLAVDQPGYILDQNDGVVQVTQWEYRSNDPSCCPSARTFTYYKWTGTIFERIK